MAIELFSIKGPSGDWHNYTPWVLADGYGLNDEDVDSEQTTRVKKDAEMRRDKLAEKWNPSIELREMPNDMCKQLFLDLRQTFFEARILTPLGMVQKEFYCSRRPASIGMIINEDNITWQKVSIGLHQR